VVLEAHRLGELQELAQHHLIEVLAREIHEQPRALAREALEPPGIAREQLFGRDGVQPRGMGGQFRPEGSTGTCGLRHGELLRRTAVMGPWRPYGSARLYRP